MNDTQLHCHTHGSNLRMLDCIVKTPQLIDKAIELGMKAVAITDHASISEHITAIQYTKELQAKGVDIKVLLGDEIYLVDSVVDVKENYQSGITKFYHFILIAKDDIGYTQLRQINADGWNSSFMTGKMRRVPNDKGQLESIIGDDKGHLLATTACIGGELAQLFFGNKIDEAYDFINWCIDLFGRDNFALEIQPSNNSDQISFNKWAWETSNKFNIKCISSCDVHYLEQNHHDIHKAFLTSREADRGETQDFYETTYMMSTDEKRSFMPYFSDEVFNKIVNNGWEFVKDVQFIDMEHKTIIPARNLEGLDCSVHHIFKDWYEKYPYIKKFAYSSSAQDTYFLRMVEDGFMDKKQAFNETNISRIAWELEQIWLVGEKLNDKMSSYYNLVDYIVDLCWEIGFIGVSRGSVTGYYTLYLIDTHQMNPIQWNLPAYRHLNAERVSFPDVDLDSSARNRPRIIQKLREVFGKDNILNICTFKTETSKSAFKTACRGIGGSSEEGDYLSSLVPVERGKQWSVHDCLFGNEDNERKPIYQLMSEVKKISSQYGIDFIQYVSMIEGLISGISLHASGIYIFKDGYLKQNSLMKTPRGDDVTCWDMPASDYAGGLKYDSLTTECQDKLEVCTELLEEYDKIEPKDTLRETYNEYLHPDVLDYTSKEMWDSCSNGEIIDLFQFITPVGGQCIQKIQPHSLTELANANSLMRITVDGDEQPVDKFLRYKQNRQLWYDELARYGVTDKEEIQALKNVLDYCYGVPSMQEDVMELMQEPKISGLGLGDADKARKIIAKKKTQDVAGLKEQFYNAVQEHGNSINVANYVWNECIKPQLAYSFSRNHVMPYSAEALQEMNLYYRYPHVYWNCATLIVNAGLADSSNTDEDEEDYVENVKTNKTTDYGKIAKAIYRSMNFGVPILPPDINEAGLSFKPIETTNSILFGIAGIAGINQDIANQVISNRPYHSFKQFYTANSYDGTLITPSKFIQLIKAGCFDCFDQDRVAIMKRYVMYSTSPKNALTMANLPKAITMGVDAPKALTAPYNWSKYVCSPQFFYSNHPKFKSKKIYWLDHKATVYFEHNYKSAMQEDVDWYYENDKLLIVDKAIEKAIKPCTEALKEYINTAEFIKAYNVAEMKAKFDELTKGNSDPNHWSMEAVSYYSKEHELAKVDFERYNIDRFDDLPVEPVFVEKNWGERTWRQYELSRIALTVIDRNDNHHSITGLDVDNNVVTCKFNSYDYSFYKQQISIQNGDGTKNVVDPSWLKRGQTLLVTGYRRGDNDFAIKAYKNSVFSKKVEKIMSINNKTGELELQTERYGYGGDE